MKKVFAFVVTVIVCISIYRLYIDDFFYLSESERLNYIEEYLSNIDLSIPEGLEIVNIEINGAMFDERWVAKILVSNSFADRMIENFKSRKKTLEKINSEINVADDRWCEKVAWWKPTNIKFNDIGFLSTNAFCTLIIGDEIHDGLMRSVVYLEFSNVY